MARILAMRHGITAYQYDYHDACGHNDRRIARGVALPGSPDDLWMHTTPEAMAASTLAGFRARFECALDDLRALVSGRPILVEGWGLRPELVAPIIDSPRRMVVMVTTPEFREHQIRALPRAGAIGAQVSDPARGQRNRLDRDRLVAEDAVRTAHALGIRVVEVDGTRDAEAVADTVTEQFSPYLG